MSKETLGYVRLVWVCPNCKTRNPGDRKTCSSCGSPQPEDVAFEQESEQKLLENEKEIEQAKADADIHCGFCGTRNPATATACAQCGGDLKEGKKRASGQIVGAFQSSISQTQNQCPNCGELNPPNAQSCQKCGGPLAEISRPTAIPITPIKEKQKRTVAIIFALALLFLCGMLILLGVNLFSRSELVGTVQNVGWERSIEIEQFGPITKRGWKDEIPSDAVIESCRKEFHHTQSEPAPDAEKVCGTPYTIDRGTGFGEVVQDCEYRVYLDFCEFTVKEWSTYDWVTFRDNDFSPAWPIPTLLTNQRIGDRSEIYTITFDTDQGTFELKTEDSALFTKCQLGSEWILTVNGFGNVVSISPH